MVETYRGIGDPVEDLLPNNKEISLHRVDAAVAHSRMRIPVLSPSSAAVLPCHRTPATALHNRCVICSQVVPLYHHRGVTV